MSTRVVLIIASLLYIVSLALPAFDLQTGDDSYYVGFAVVLFGWGSNDPRWLANLLLPAGLVCLKMDSRIWAVLTLFIASAFALHCMTYVGTQIALNSGGEKTTIIAMGSGYYLWSSSIIFPAIFSLSHFFFAGKKTDKIPQPTDVTRESKQGEHRPPR